MSPMSKAAISVDLHTVGSHPPLPKPLVPQICVKQALRLDGFVSLGM